MVLLGTKSLTSTEPVTKDVRFSVPGMIYYTLNFFLQHGTMILVMESLEGEMKVRPRYWERLLQVFTSTLEGTDTPPLMLQVGCSGCLLQSPSILHICVL